MVPAVADLYLVANFVGAIGRDSAARRCEFDGAARRAVVEEIGLDLRLEGECSFFFRDMAIRG